MVGLVKKEVALFSGDIASAFRLRILSLLDVFLPDVTRSAELTVFLAAVFLETMFTNYFFLRLF